ncbi:uncharacterized protein E0L32_011287 [Thyridium curvatum]|uniref:Inositolphosphotransferase Aur1/Ipt1 domain-containing protein n=1 Tax=Thyridium curvatum TaxID=1093900 RepID=A0A507BHP9_9PEZI|nr:uncharacterized protein E0L32_011287 [Thyridium curvatum]TPX19043.1 hypothetical protein E0L32_011287 [Thyridium curvatum]
MDSAGLESAPEWQSGHVWKMPEWVEPVGIVGILLTAMLATRRRNYSIFSGEPYTKRPAYSRAPPSSASPFDSPRSSTSLASGDSELSLLRASLRNNLASSSSHPPKTRRLLGLWTIRTPNSSRFAGHYHSRVLQKFPFLVEMFYWVVTYFFYQLTAVLSRVWWGGTKGLWDVAQDHAIAILELEAVALGAGGLQGTRRWAEWRIQQWFLAGADAADWRGVGLTVLNRVYALIHIPGTVGFIAFYYWFAPSHVRFCTVRRTMSLVNMFAFLIFLGYPCMPPRFLPSEFGFVDTVNAEDAQSVWMSGQYVNKLAAMPSMHFGYAFCIGCVFVYESGFLRGVLNKGGRLMIGGARDDLEESALKLDDDYCYHSESAAALATPAPRTGVERKRSFRSRLFFLFFGLSYPSLILLAIVATGNHYFADAAVAALIVAMAYVCNRVLLVFLPVEDYLLWALRLEKPVPTVGLRR